MDALERMRASTASHHQDLENRLGLVSRVATTAGRRTVVSRFAALHAGAEAALEPALGQLPGLAFETRRRSPFLARDLAALDTLAPAAAPFPVPRSEAEALGLFYVLEGSTLGGAVIRKQLAARGADMTGLSFLHPYGERTGEMWRDFMAVVRSKDADDDAEAMAAGAVRGFEAVAETLCDDRAAA